MSCGYPIILIYLVHRGTAKDGICCQSCQSFYHHTIHHTTNTLRQRTSRSVSSAERYIIIRDVLKMTKEDQNTYIISLLYQLGLVASEEAAQPAPEDDLYSPETVRRE